MLRIGRDWEGLRSSLPASERDHAEPERDHPYARDLDVLGTASLIHLAGPVASERGRQVLYSWLLAPAAPEEARQRQGAVRELAPAAELRAEVTALGRMVADDASRGIEHLIGWAEREPWILGQRWLRVASWVLPPLVLAGVVAQVVLGCLHFGFFPPFRSSSRTGALGGGPAPPSARPRVEPDRCGASFPSSPRSTD
jgi:hypothetical protein